MPNSLDRGHRNFIEGIGGYSNHRHRVIGGGNVLREADLYDPGQAATEYKEQNTAYHHHKSPGYDAISSCTCPSG